MKKLLPLIFIFFLLACQNTSTTSEQGNGIFEKISKENFVKKMEEKTSKIILDVRTPEEFEKGTIEGAININFYDKNFDEQLSNLDKSKPTFIFCKSGGRSGKTFNKMKTMEFTEVYELKGGYSAWKK